MRRDLPQGTGTDVTLLQRFSSLLAKSDGTTLLEHAASVCEDCARLCRLVPGYRREDIRNLLVASFIHDVGKMSPTFQDILRGKSDRRIKHEAHSLDYYREVEDSASDICRFISDCSGEDCTGELCWEDIWGFVVSHHGLLTLVRRGEQLQATRDWTGLRPEDEAITLADLLWRYYPLGGAVILSDLIDSASRAGYHSIRKALWEATSLEGVKTALEEVATPYISPVTQDLLELLLIG